MHMLKTVISVALFAAAAIAQTTTLAFTSFPDAVTAGTPVTVTWTGGDPTQPVTITLRKGLSSDLKTVGVLTTTATGGSYTWTPDSSLVDGSDYALEISQGTDSTNYSKQFPLTGGSTAAASSSAAASTTASSAALVASSSAATSTGISTTSAASSTGSTLSTSATKSSTSSATSSKTSASSTSTSTSTTVPSSGASGLQSPLALLFGVVAAIMYLQ